MAIIPAVVTTDARKFWPQFFGTLLGISAGATTPGVAWNPLIKNFKVGEGGWQDFGAGAVPRTPDPNLRLLTGSLIQDIDAIVDPTRALANQRYPTTGRATFTKALTAPDFTFETASTIRIRCLLDFGEFNNDGFGNDPEIWEIGIFADHPTVAASFLMVAYATFPKEIKNGAKQLENVVRITF